MHAPVRVRLHPDGRAAVGLPGPLWLLLHGSERQWRGDDRDCPLDGGWVELLVAEVPEPDGWITDDGAQAPWWGTSDGGRLIAWVDGVEGRDGLVEDLRRPVADAVALLAACAACERYRPVVSSDNC